MSNSLLKFSLTISLIGIFFLLVLNLTLQPKQITTKNINQSQSYVKISGKIISQKNYDDFSLLILEDNHGKTQISCFKCPSLINKSVILEGKIEEYQNKKQINAEKIIEK